MCLQELPFGSTNWHEDIGEDVSKSDGSFGRGPEHSWSLRVFMNQSCIKAVCNPIVNMRFHHHGEPYTKIAGFCSLSWPTSTTIIDYRSIMEYFLCPCISFQKLDIVSIILTWPNLTKFTDRLVSRLQHTLSFISPCPTSPYLLTTKQSPTPRLSKRQTVNRPGLLQ